MTNQNQSDKKQSRPRQGGGHRHWGHNFEKAGDPKSALRRMLPYLKPHITILVIVFILVLLTTLLGLTTPYLMGRAIDDHIAQKDLPGLVNISIIIGAIYLASGIFQAASGWLMARLSQTVLKKLRSDLFGHIQSLSLRFFDSSSAGDLMSRLTNDIDAINQAVSQNVTSLFASILSLVGIVVVMFLLNFWLAFAAILVVPIMFFFTSYIAKYTRKGFRRLQKQLGVLNGTMEESISGLRVVKSFRRGDSVIKTFRESNEAVYSAGLYANNYALMLMPITSVLGNFFVIVLAGLGGFLALQGLATIGTIAAFISYGNRFIQPVRQLANLYNSIQAALAGSERVFEIFDTSPEISDAEDAIPIQEIEGIVEFTNVDFAYVEDVPVIKGLDLSVKAGETIALVGPTGAGKTTLINLLTRFYDIQNGNITIDGKNIQSVKKADLRRRLGLVLQDTFLFSGTVRENIRYGRLGASDEECKQAAILADADHFIRLLPYGYETQLTERGNNVSQGQRQLITIARAILANPSILILDEATSSVDTRTEARIQQSLLRLMEGRTSFVIAHRLSTIRDADRVICIDEGELVEQGTHQELLDKQGFYHSLYTAQFKGKKI